MGDMKKICPVCDCESSDLGRGLKERGVCIYCGATQELIDAIWDTWEAYDPDPEGIETIDEPVAVKLLKSYWLANAQLEAQNGQLIKAMRGISSAIKFAEELTGDGK